MLTKKNIKKTSNSNRVFGIFFSFIFFIIALWPLMINGQEIRYWLILLAILFLILGLINSKLLTPLNKGWIKLGFFLGKLVTPVLMGLVYFLVVTPIGIIMRLIGKDLLNLKKNKSKTYWIKRNITFNSMKNQF